MPNLWLLPRPLILASKSQARRTLLAAAGIPFEAIDAEIDERVVEEPLRFGGADGAAIAAALARGEGGGGEHEASRSPRAGCRSNSLP